MTKFLVIRFSSIGDIVLTSPIVRCLKEQVKGAEVHFLVKKQFAYTVDFNPNIDKRFYYDDNLHELIRQLRKENYDAVIDLQHNFRSSKIKRAIGTKWWSFNKLNIEKWLFVNFKINRLPDVHIVDRYFETVKQLGVVNDGQGLDFFIDKKDEINLADLPVEFQSRLLSGGYIGFVVGAKHFTKQLPKEKILSICQKINKPIIFLGGKEDCEKAEWILVQLQTANRSRLKSGLQIAFNACGKFNLGQSASLIKQSQLIITHDTGLMHIAAAFKKKIISVWGNTVPEFGMYPYYGSSKTENKIFEIKNLSCRPCSKIGFEKCPKGHFKCMNLIDEEEVEKKMLELMSH